MPIRGAEGWGEGCCGLGEAGARDGQVGQSCFFFAKNAALLAGGSAAFSGADAMPFSGACQVGQHPFATLRCARDGTQRKGTACPYKFHLRKMTTRQTARLRKACAAVLFWHQKSTQKSAAVAQAADPRASRGAPAGAAVFPWCLRRSVLANAKSKAFAFTASRVLPFARRPAWAGESAHRARRHPPPPHPNGPAHSRPAAEPVSFARTKSNERNTSTSPAKGLGGKAPILESRSRPTERGANVWSICC